MAGTGAIGAVRVKGLKELNQALNAYNKDLRKELRAELRIVAQPVKEMAASLALGEITNMTAHWARMRLGIAAESVYIVPASRRAGGTARPNLTDLMLDRAMEPSLEQNKDHVLHGLERMLDTLADRHGF